MPVQDRYSTVQQRFQEVSPQEFKDELQKLWNAGLNIRESVEDVVENNLITPVQGLAIMACVTGQLFGYQQFHGQASPSDLAQIFDTRQN